MFGLSLEQRRMGCKKKYQGPGTRFEDRGTRNKDKYHTHAKAQGTQRIPWQKIKTTTQKASGVMLCELSVLA
jgi:hypothetical protein